MNDSFDIRLKAFVVVGAVGVGVILLAEFAHMAFNQGIKRIAMAERPRKITKRMGPVVYSSLFK